MGSLGLTEMHMKGSPTDPVWHGAQGPDKDYPDAKGFVVLNSLPRTAPQLVELKTGARLQHAETLASKNSPNTVSAVSWRGVWTGSLRWPNRVWCQKMRR
jgi:hypothetical protein